MSDHPRPVDCQGDGRHRHRAGEEHGQGAGLTCACVPARAGLTMKPRDVAALGDIAVERRARLHRQPAAHAVHQRGSAGSGTLATHRAALAARLSSVAGAWRGDEGLLPHRRRGLASQRVPPQEDIDTTMKFGCNMPMGPLRLADLIGLDTWCAGVPWGSASHPADARQPVHHAGAPPRLRRLEVPAGPAAPGDDCTCAPPRTLGPQRARGLDCLQKYVDAQLLGEKSGRGFYTYGPNGVVN
jgi:hypothetical protein